MKLSLHIAHTRTRKHPNRTIEVERNTLNRQEYIRTNTTNNIAERKSVMEIEQEAKE